MTFSTAPSLATSRVVAFAATTNADKARAFFGDVLGLQLVSDDPYAIVFDAHGTMLRVQKVESVSPPPYTVLGWRVDDINRVVGQLVERGIQFELYAWMEQDTLGVWTTPAGARVAWFKDPDGNILSLTQFTDE